MNWSIEIQNFLGGFSPAYYKETYPSYGNKNQAGAMLNADLTNAGYLSQGPGLATLTAGDQTGGVTTLIRGITDYAVAADTAYAIGGAKLYQFSSTAVANAGIWPHTIDKGTVTGEDGEDVVLYQGNIYYSYNHSGSAGDIGIYDQATTFDDDWGSTVPTGAAALSNAPHPMAVGADEIAIGNGRYVATWNGTTFIPQALDLPAGATIVGIKWVAEKWWITANLTSLTGTNKNIAYIYVWDGTTDSWEGEIRLNGLAGGSFTKGEVLFQFYQDISSTGGYKLGYVSGNTVVDVANYSGGLPSYYQITEYKDLIIWNSAGSIYAFGSGDKDLPIRFFQFADGGHATVGGIACPFGTPLFASNVTTSYKLAKFSGYDVNSNWKSLMFDITAGGQVSKIQNIRINFEQLATGARVDWKLLNNKGQTIYSDIISYTKLGAVTTTFYPINGKVAENFRIEFDYANGDTTNTVKIKNAKIYGSYN